jgi:hypothetical protein
MTKIARTRIRRYKPHGSALWVMCLHQPDEMARGAVIARRIEKMCSHFEHPIAGFALVVWDGRESSACDWDIWAHRIPNVLVPDFAAERIRMEIFQDKTINRMEEDGLI